VGFHHVAGVAYDGVERVAPDSGADGMAVSPVHGPGCATLVAAPDMVLDVRGHTWPVYMAADNFEHGNGADMSQLFVERVEIGGAELDRDERLGRGRRSGAAGGAGRL
jgi:hypothetical protein